MTFRSILSRIAASPVTFPVLFIIGILAFLYFSGIVPLVKMALRWQDEPSHSIYAYSDLNVYCETMFGTNDKEVVAIGYNKPLPWVTQVFCAGYENGLRTVTQAEGQSPDEPKKASEFSTSDEHSPALVITTDGYHLPGGGTVFNDGQLSACPGGKRPLAIDNISVIGHLASATIYVNGGNLYCLEDGTLVLREGTTGKVLASWPNFVEVK